MLLLRRSLQLGCQRDDRRLLAGARDELHTGWYARAVDAGGDRHRGLPSEVPWRRVGDPWRAAEDRADAAAVDALSEPWRGRGGRGSEDDVDVVEDAVDPGGALGLLRHRTVGASAEALADPHNGPRARLEAVRAAEALGVEVRAARVARYEQRPDVAVVGIALDRQVPELGEERDGALGRGAHLRVQLAREGRLVRDGDPQRPRVGPRGVGEPARAEDVGEQRGVVHRARDRPE